MEWTCCVCEHQVDERYFDTEERMCDECMNLAYPDGIEDDKHLPIILAKPMKYQCKCGELKSPFKMGPIVGTCRICLKECDRIIEKQNTKLHTEKKESNDNPFGLDDL